MVEIKPRNGQVIWQMPTSTANEVFNVIYSMMNYIRVTFEDGFTVLRAQTADLTQVLEIKCLCATDFPDFDIHIEPCLLVTTKARQGSFDKTQLIVDEDQMTYLATTESWVGGEDHTYYILNRPKHSINAPKIPQKVYDVMISVREPNVLTELLDIITRNGGTEIWFATREGELFLGSGDDFIGRELPIEVSSSKVDSLSTYSCRLLNGFARLSSLGDSSTWEFTSDKEFFGYLIILEEFAISYIAAPLIAHHKSTKKGWLCPDCRRAKEPKVKVD